MTQDALFELDGAPARASAGPRFTPLELARMLGQPPPTRQQVEIIAAPVEPLLVIAGAGSGKTETMAGRVVWLVANGHVRADEVLGLTFTRKAAGERAEGIQRRLTTIGEYERRGLLPHLEEIEARGDLARFWEQQAASSARDRHSAFEAMLDGLESEFGTGPRTGSVADDLLQRARVSTYNSF